MRDSNPRPSAWEADVLPGWTNAAQAALQLLEIKDLPAMKCNFTTYFSCFIIIFYPLLHRVPRRQFYTGAGLLIALAYDTQNRWILVHLAVLNLYSPRNWTRKGFSDRWALYLWNLVKIDPVDRLPTFVKERCFSHMVN